MTKQSTPKYIGLSLAIAMLILSAGCSGDTVATTIDGRSVVAHVGPVNMASVKAESEQATFTINSTKILVTTTQLSWSNGSIALPEHWRSIELIAGNGGIDVRVDGNSLGRIS